MLVSIKECGLVVNGKIDAMILKSLLKKTLEHINVKNFESTQRILVQYLKTLTHETYDKSSVKII